MPPLTKWRVHLTLREFRFSLTAFLRALLLANHCTVPSLRMNISPVPGSIISPEKVQILCSGMLITYSLVYELHDQCLVASKCHPDEQVQAHFL